MSNGCKIWKPYDIIDVGSIKELVGGDGWEILHVSDNNKTLWRAMEGMDIHTFPKVDTVIEVKYDKGQVLLLILGG